MEMISRQPDAKNTTNISTFRSPVVSPFGANNSLTNPIGPSSCKRPENPTNEKNYRHGERQIQIGIRAAEQWLVNRETVRSLVSPSNRANSGNETEPICRQNENKNSCQKPKCPFHQMRANDALQEIRIDPQLAIPGSSAPRPGHPSCRASQFWRR